MPSDQPNPTLADYVAMAISPALIMGLVGSLVFFLLEVLYSGQYEGRLQCTLFFFVFGAVLIARISMLDIAPRANLYGLVLGVLVWIGMQIFVEYPPESAASHLSWFINLVLIAVVWWCAHRLTWDCTYVEDETDAGGGGLLEAAGLTEPAGKQQEEVEFTVEQEGKAKAPGWWERYKRYREERKKHRTPGVWVVYFSLAALPLFGLGQSLIPVDETARRKYVFWLMSVYVACGLGLLLTTCFLGLRRYLRQRRLQMPAAMTGVWLTSGAVLISLLLAAGALLPRPQAEYPLLPLGSAKSKERTASRFAVKGGRPAKGEGRPGADAPADRKDPANATGKNGKGPGKGGEGKGKEGSGQGKQGKGQGDNQSGKDSSGKGNDRRDQPANRDPNNQRNPGQQNRQDNNNNSSRGSSGQQQSKGDRANQSGKTASSSSSPMSSSRLGSMLQSLGRVLKWVVFGVLALLVLFAVLRGGLGFLANFTDWARRLLDAWRNFWANLFGGSKQAADEEGEGGEEAAAAAARPFASFRNPFTEGTRMATPELIRYTFTAFQAWARERDLGRQPGETPLEFAERVGGEVPALEAAARRLATLYARAVYARGALPANSAEVVRQFWERLEAIAEQPMSA